VKLTLAQTATFASLWEQRLSDDDLRALGSPDIQFAPSAGF
jgi:hypothetical protein